MKFIIWNTRGAHSANSKCQSDAPIKTQNPTVVALLETKMVDHKHITETLRFEEYLELSTLGRKRGIVFMWKGHLLNLKHFFSSHLGIHATS